MSVGSEWPRLDSVDPLGGIQRGQLVTYLGYGRVTKMYQVQIKHVHWAEWRSYGKPCLTYRQAQDGLVFAQCLCADVSNYELWSFRIVEV